MSFSKIIIASVFVFALVSCGGKDEPTQSSPKKTVADSSPSCSESEGCEKKCKDLFGSNNKVKQCLLLSSNAVQGIEGVFSESRGYLESPSEDDLSKVKGLNIENALEIDEDIWSDLIKDYTGTEAKRVLYWVATQKEIYPVIEISLNNDKDDIENFFEDLLAKVKVSSFTDFMTYILDEDVEDNFIVLASKEKQTSAVEFMIQRAEEDCPTTDYNSADDLKVGACLLGQVFCEKQGNDYAFKTVFESVLDVSNDVKDFIEEGESGDEDFSDGLGVLEKNSNDIKKVCTAATSQQLPG